MERVKSSNGKHDKVLADGYAYNYFRSAKDHKDDSVKIYRCDKYNAMHCEAKLRVIESTYTLVGAHIDVPNPGRCDVIKVSASMKRTALSCSDPPRRIYSDNVVGLSSEAAVSLPQYESSQCTCNTTC